MKLNDKEKWVPILGYETRYEISNMGRVKSIFKKSEKIKKPHLDGGKYWSLNLYEKYKIKAKTIHRLVAEHFIPNPYNKPQINHIDGNKLNNAFYNLEWCTASENSIHAFNTGLRVPSQTGKFNENHHRSKPIYRYSITNEYIDSFPSVSEAARILGVRVGNIAEFALRPEEHAHSYGYKWSYEKRDKF